MNNNQKEECMMWSENGVRLQTYNQYGELRLSDLGCLSLTSVQDFCERRGIKLYVARREPAAIVGRPQQPVQVGG